MTAQIMGILNVTPDSFSDGGRYQGLEAALRHAERLIAEGAHWLDIGGESTRPGAAEVPEAEEVERVVPVVEAIKARFDVKVSVDTSKAAVMKGAIAAGADMINDVRALREPGALAAVAASDVLVCLMHMQGQPRTMQAAPQYQDLMGEVSAFLMDRVAACEGAGIKRERIWLDPGFGFGKSLEDNYVMLNRLEEFQALGLPLLVGMSRKSMVGQLLDRPVDERLAGSLACALVAVQRGADIIRVHDVQATQDVLKVWQAITTECKA
ncbi:dihydropteroate synthase [Gallaecimonas kandeliae]|uniref:dihydropteroate synthase n=1 Tax=Gallaecimonas kandeliae TaxID=3029055 RepID=UPI0026486144|nr:dihydropteroate synthase [Gallaecimonas kandeliae]WKE66596.1 dihydropteroate synthase [Gallaecimonas kandeliae]